MIRIHQYSQVSSLLVMGIITICLTSASNRNSIVMVKASLAGYGLSPPHTLHQNSEVAAVQDRGLHRYQLKERQTWPRQRQLSFQPLGSGNMLKVPLDQIATITLTYSEDSPAKVFAPFYMSLYDTSGSLPSSPSLEVVQVSMQSFMRAELDQYYPGPDNEIKQVRAVVLSQSATSTSRKLSKSPSSTDRELVSTGSELEMQLSVIFRTEPSPDVPTVDAQIKKILSNLTYFITNLTDWAQGDVHLANVTSAEIVRYGNLPSNTTDDGGSAIVDSNNKKSNQNVSVQFLIPIIAVGCVLFGSVGFFLIRARQRQVEMASRIEEGLEGDYDVDGGALVHDDDELMMMADDMPDIDIILQDEENDIFSVEATLVESVMDRRNIQRSATLQSLRPFSRAQDASSSDPSMLIVSEEAALGTVGAVRKTKNRKLSLFRNRFSRAAPSTSSSSSAIAANGELIAANGGTRATALQFFRPHLQTADDQSDVFTGVDSPAGGGQIGVLSSPMGERSVFSFFSAISAFTQATFGDASTVIASNKASATPNSLGGRIEGQEDLSGAALASAAALAVAAGVVGTQAAIQAAGVLTPHSRASSLFTFSEEDETDLLDSDVDDNLSPIDNSANSLRHLSTNQIQPGVASQPATPTKRSISDGSTKVATETPPRASISKRTELLPPTPLDRPYDEPSPVAKSKTLTGILYNKRKPDDDSSAFGPSPAHAPTLSTGMGDSHTAGASLRLVAVASVGNNTTISDVSPMTAYDLGQTTDTRQNSEDARATPKEGDSAALAKSTSESRSEAFSEEIQKRERGRCVALTVATGAAVAAATERVRRQRRVRSLEKKEAKDTIDAGYSSDPGPDIHSPESRSPSEVRLPWSNPKEVSRNRAVAAAFAETVLTTTSSASRRHAKSTQEDGTTNYQQAAMEGDGSFEDGMSVSSAPVSEAELGGAVVIRGLLGKGGSAMKKKNEGITVSIPHDQALAPPDANTTPHSTTAVNLSAAALLAAGATTPHSAVTNASSISALSTGSTEPSPSKQLINDLVWLEKKLLASKDKVNTNTMTRQLTSSPPGALYDECDSLSFLSGEESEVYSTDSTAYAYGPRQIKSSEVHESIPTVICRDCYAPPGKLKIVIHSTRDGPAVHTVKKGSSLEGHIFPGDLIISVDNVDTRAYTAEQVMKMMTARTKFERKITVLHYDEGSPQQRYYQQPQPSPTV